MSTPVCILDSSNFTITEDHSTLACLQEMPAILRNTSDYELQSLAEDLQSVVPYFQLLLAELVRKRPVNHTLCINTSISLTVYYIIV